MYKTGLVFVIILLSVFSTYSVYAAPSAKLLDTYGYLDEFGHYVVVGEVLNDGDVPLHFVEIVVTFLDQDAQQLQQLPVSTALEVLHPGQTSPFMATLRDTQDAPFVKSYSTEMGNKAPTTYKESKLVVIFHKLETFEDSVVVSGRVVNDGSSSSTNTKATVVLYNVIGEPVRFSSVFTDPKDILPFGSALFSTRIKVDKALTISGYAISSESSQYAETKRLVQIQKTGMERIAEVVDIADFFTFDVNNRAVSTIRVEEPVLVKLSVTNKLAENREYTYILKVTDQDGFVSSLSWSTGVLAGSQNNAAAIAWVPDEPGTYRLEAFVWKSMEEPIPLAFRTLTRNLQVQ